MGKQIIVSKSLIDRLADMIRIVNGINPDAFDLNRYTVDAMPAKAVVAGKSTANAEKLKNLSDYNAEVVDLTGINITVTKLGYYVLAGRPNLTTLIIPKITTLPASCLKGNPNLVKVDFADVVTIENNVFAECPKLATVILRSATVCNITNIATTIPHGNIYVPDTLIEQYKTKYPTLASGSIFLTISDLPVT